MLTVRHFLEFLIWNLLRFEMCIQPEMTETGQNRVGMIAYGLVKAMTIEDMPLSFG